MKRIVLLVAAAGALATPAVAHRLKVFAAVEGGTISGHAYLTGGGRAKTVPVRVLGPDGRELLRVLTDSEGRFSLAAPYRCDLRLVADSGDGHRGEWVIRADELPENLPTWENQRGEGAETPAPEKTEPSPPEERATRVLPMDAMRAIIREEVHPLQAQLARYAEQVDGYRRETRLHDVLAGIGYLVGGAGLWAYLRGRRARKGA